MQRRRFVLEGGEWFINLPKFLTQGGSKADLQMVSGANAMLDRIAGNEADVNLQSATKSFDGADKLTLTELCDPIPGGGYYCLKSFEGKPVKQVMWLCGVTLFVLNGIPEKIFMKRVK